MKLVQHDTPTTGNPPLTDKFLMSLTHQHYTSLLATINEKFNELEALVLDKIQIDTHTTELTQQQTYKLQILESKLSVTREKIEKLKAHKTHNQPRQTDPLIKHPGPFYHYHRATSRNTSIHDTPMHSISQTQLAIEPKNHCYSKRQSYS